MESLNVGGSILGSHGEVNENVFLVNVFLVLGKIAEGEWRRGTSPLRSLRYGREPLGSSGSNYPAVGF
jgi:hypothetical protein